MGEFLLELLDDIAFAGDIEISVNFSYLLQDKQGEITYVHASKVTYYILYYKLEHVLVHVLTKY